MKAINDASPKEYQGPKEIKQFVDKYYDDIVKCAKLLESEPTTIKKTDIKMIIRVAIAYFGIPILAGILAYAGTLVGVGGAAVLSIGVAGAGMAIAGLSAIVSVISGIFAIVSGAMYLVIRYGRKTNDAKAIAELSKIGNAMKKAQNQKDMPREYKNKITDLLDAISSAEIEMSKRVVTATANESYTDAKLKIYDACMNGIITESQKDKLLAEFE